MDQLIDSLRDFNAQSRDTEDHFKLCTTHSPLGTPRHEVRLCSSHPPLITCTADATRIHVRSNGPYYLRRRSFGHDKASLTSLFVLLREHRNNTSATILDWELEDWVSACYPCQAFTTLAPPEFRDLGFMPEDLWCIDTQPSRAASI